MIVEIDPKNELRRLSPRDENYENQKDEVPEKKIPINFQS